MTLAEVQEFLSKLSAEQILTLCHDLESATMVFSESLGGAERGDPRLELLNWDESKYAIVEERSGKPLFDNVIDHDVFEAFLEKARGLGVEDFAERVLQPASFLLVLSKMPISIHFSDVKRGLDSLSKTQNVFSGKLSDVEEFFSRNGHRDAILHRHFMDVVHIQRGFLRQMLGDEADMRHFGMTFPDPEVAKRAEAHNKAWSRRRPSVVEHPV